MRSGLHITTLQLHFLMQVYESCHDKKGKRVAGSYWSPFGFPALFARTLENGKFISSEVLKNGVHSVTTPLGDSIALLVKRGLI